MDRFVEMMNATNFVAERMRRTHPEENVIFASAATLVHSSRTELVGISLSRVFQHRGVLLLTDRTLRFRSGFANPLMLLWTFVVVYCLWGYISTRAILDLVCAILLGLYILQRLPYGLDLPLASLSVANRATVRGLFASGHGLVVSNGPRYLHFVTVKRVPIGMGEANSDDRDAVSPSEP